MHSFILGLRSWCVHLHEIWFLCVWCRVNGERWEEGGYERNSKNVNWKCINLLSVFETNWYKKKKSWIQFERFASSVVITDALTASDSIQSRFMCLFVSCIFWCVSDAGQQTYGRRDARRKKYMLLDWGLGGSTHQTVCVVLKIGMHKMKGKREVGVAGGERNGGK